MKHILTTVLLGVTLLFAGNTSAQVTFNGNNNTGFGNVIGESSMSINDDGTTVTITFTKGSSNFGNEMVIYIDSKSGGFSNTANFADPDAGDKLRRAITGAGIFSGGTRSVVNFPNGFQADYAVAVNTGFGGLWELVNNASFPFVIGTGKPDDATDAEFTITFNKTNIGLGSGDELVFRFLVTYLDAFGGGGVFRSDEGYGVGLPSDNPGTSDVTYTSYFEYPSGLEITNSKSASITHNSAGWRLLSSPAVVPFNTWLSGIWTQGGAGANTTNGTSNVFTSSQSVGTTLDRQNITDFTQNVQAGRGYAVYVYESDFGGGRSGWPKALTLSGAESAAPVAVEFVALGENTLFALAGNPFSSTIQFDNLTRNQSLKNTVWVYNPASDAYISRSNGSGSFDGLITPFQGFWVTFGEGEGNGTLTFPASAKTSGGTFYSKEVQRPRLVMDFTDGTFSNSAWVTFDQSASEGYDQMDADQFSGMSGVGAQFYTIVDNKPVDINFIPAEFDEIIEFPLGYYTSQGGTVSITVRELTLPENVTASIVNTSTGEAIILDNDVVISFEAPVSKRNPAEDNKLTASVQASQFKIRFTPPTSTSTEIGTDLPVGVELSQNYPNPFNPATQIRFAVPVSGEVRLAVYDLLGREIAVLVNGGMSAGSHSVNFDAASLGSGVYVYRLDAAGQTLTRKMTLVK